MIFDKLTHGEELALRGKYVLVVERSVAAKAIRWDVTLISRGRKPRRATAHWVAWPDKGHKDDPPLDLMIQHAYYLHRRKEAGGWVGHGEHVNEGVLR